MKLLSQALLFIVIVLTACGNSSEKKSQELNDQAASHYQKHDLASTIEVYQKSLDIYENEEARTQLQNIKIESNAVREALEIFKEVKKYQTEIMQVKYDNDILEPVKNIQDALIRLKNIKSPSKTEISNYILSLEENYFFFLESHVDRIIISIQFSDGDIDLTKFNEEIDEFLNKSLVLDLYKI